MKLIRRRKKSPTPFERATGFVKLGVKGLVVQRAARRAVRTYKFAKRAVPIAALAAVGAAIAKKVRGGGETSSGTSYTPPPASTASGAGAPGGDKAGSAYDSAEQGETPTDGELEVEAPNESTPPPPEKTTK
jgi:hypothetical protein